MDINEELVKALDYSESIVVLTDVKGIIRYVNNSFVEKYGYSKDEVIGKNTKILKSDYHNMDFYDDLWRTISNDETWNGTFKNIKKDGNYIWEKATISAVKDTAGKLSGYIAVKEDVTRQMELEEQLKKDKYLLDELFNNSPVGIAILKPVYGNKHIEDLIVIKANPFAGNLVGKYGLVGLKISDVLPEININKKRIKQMLKRKTSFEYNFVDLGKYLSCRSIPFGEEGICFFFYDVSQYIQTVKALEESEKRYFTLMEDAPALICRFDRNGNLIYVNNQYSDTFEIQQELLIGKNIFDWFSEEQRKETIKKIADLTPESPINVVEHQLFLENGDVKWIRWIDRALVDSDGEIYEYQSVGMDLTPLKQTELSLIRHRNKLDAIINSTVVGIGVVNTEGNFVLVNDRLISLLGYDNQDEMYKLNLMDITHNYCRDMAYGRFKKLLDGEINDYNIECRFMRKGGSFFWGDSHVSPIKDVDGDIVEVICIVTDINKKKQYELQLKDSESKLRELNATKDKLFSIIAHDIKNPFNTILGFSTLLSHNFESYTKEEAKFYINQMFIAADNVYKLLDDLLIWAKTQLGQMHVVRKNLSLKDIVDESFSSYGALAENKEISLVNDVDNDVVVYADCEMFKFVIRNIIHNGIKFTNPKGDVRCSSYQEKDYLVLSIKDTGIGISEDKLNKLFEVGEFMSTAGTLEEKGTGLGLHLSKGLVTKNGGMIKVNSEVGVGTEFKVYLPVVDDKQSKAFNN